MPDDKQVPPRSYQDLAEQRIQDAYTDGQFESLPGYGAPIANIDDELDDDWWIKEKLRRERISILPPSIEILRDVEQTLARLPELKSERSVRREIAALNDRIREANFRSVWGPPSTQMPLDVEEVVARWRGGSPLAAEQERPRSH
jgi:hypothetical protein